VNSMIKPRPVGEASFRWGEYAEGLFDTAIDMLAMYGWRIVFTVAAIYALKPYVQRWAAARSLAQEQAPERVRVLDAARARAREEQIKKFSSATASNNTNVTEDTGSIKPKAFPSSTF
jgi:hypothetical protein